MNLRRSQPPQEALSLSTAGLHDLFCSVNAEATSAKRERVQAVLRGGTIPEMLWMSNLFNFKELGTSSHSEARNRRLKFI